MTDQIDIFDQLGQTDWEDVDTSMPVLNPGLIEFKVNNMEVKTSERTGNRYIACDFRTTVETTDVEGKPVPPGYPVQHIFGLAKTEKFDPMKNIAEFMDAVLGNRMWDPTFEAYMGQTFYAKTKVGKERQNEESGETYPARTEISRFMKQA